MPTLAEIYCAQIKTPLSRGFFDPVQDQSMSKETPCARSRFRRAYWAGSICRDVEAQVLARAVQAHIHLSSFLNGNRTVVFPDSPGAFAFERMG